jgi:hypothetical protein
MFACRVRLRKIKHKLIQKHLRPVILNESGQGQTVSRISSSSLVLGKPCSVKLKRLSNSDINELKNFLPSYFAIIETDDETTKDEDSNRDGEESSDSEYIPDSDESSLSESELYEPPLKKRSLRGRKAQQIPSTNPSNPKHLYPMLIPFVEDRDLRLPPNEMCEEISSWKEEYLVGADSVLPGPNSSVSVITYKT